MAKAQGSNVYSSAPEYVAACDGDLPPEIFHDELKAIIKRRETVGVPAPDRPDRYVQPSTDFGLTGLAISGGGIRSATFSLGVMQAFAAADILKNVDYLSTVSGGGYSGSSLTWALYGQPETNDPEHREFIRSMGVGPDSFPIGTHDPRLETPAKADVKRQKLLKYLREHGKYLTPGGGISSLSFIGILLRGLLLNVLVWIAFASCLFYIALSNESESIFRSWSAMLGLLIVFLSISVAYSLGTFLHFLGSLRYLFRRFFERVTVPIFVLLFLSVAIGTLGWAHAAIEKFIGSESISLGMILSGAGSGLWAYKQTASNEPGRKSAVPVGLVATFGSLLLLYGGVLGSFILADHVFHKFGANNSLVYWVLGGIALVVGWFVNINDISLHRYYRDRLMETFMPGIDRAIDDVTGPSPEADHAKLSAMWNDKNARGPYHIVNTNLVTVDSNRRTQRTRGGDSFILSPFYCGGTVTGWRRTEKFERDQMTLATAMAISAAAANPNSGVAGQGLTRNKFVSVLMALLNLRLGYWTHRPRKARSLWFAPNHFWPGAVYEMAGRLKEDSVWLQLTDGGHFENLALYEMIRRRLKLIIVLDGGADPEFDFADLQNACRRIGTDFGTRISFAKETADDPASNRTADLATELSALTYKQWTRDEESGVVASSATRSGSSGFPKYRATAEKGWIHGTIHYKGGVEQGDLIYIKTTMVDGLSLTTLGYKDSNPTFPDQTTADQFFEPEQFAAYRELGYVIGVDAVDEIRKCLCK